jgi:hypothetical protein
MKYFIGKITEFVGDMEFSDDFLFETAGDPGEYMEKTASTWRGDLEKDECTDGLWWTDGVSVSDEGFREVPLEDFKILSKYMVKL